MRFGSFSLDDAAGAILAHTLPVAGGTIKKGCVLEAADIARLRASGLTSVVAARLEHGDVGEDEAAGRLSVALRGDGVRVPAPFTGRANVVAAVDGIVTFDAVTVGAINAVDERITLATLKPFERVTAGQMLATVKIIPFAVPGDVLDRVVSLAAQAAIGVQAFSGRRVHLILTRLAATKDSVLAKRRTVISDRIAACGGVLVATEVVPHTEAAAGAAIKAGGRDADVVLVFSASAIVDRGDVVPAALVGAGGRIEHLGMPVDPGNLLLLGDIGRRVVIGIPSCAGSPKLNGFDWVLERVLAGLPVGRADIAAMGVGGLLKEIPTRPQPREQPRAQAGRGVMPERGGRRPQSIGAVVLAAGRASRMGENKLVAEAGGVAIVRRTVATLLEAGLDRVLVVTGHESARVRDAVEGLPVTFVDNPDFAAGLSTSLKAGLAALPRGLDGVFVALGDMPEVGVDVYRAMVAAFDPDDGRGIVVPIAGGKRGNPVLWGARYVDDMMSAEGDTGAKHLLGANANDVVEVEVDGIDVLVDIDTPDALAALRERLR